jgi:hypothetical protein
MKIYIAVVAVCLMLGGCATWDSAKKSMQESVCPECKPVVVEKQIPCPEVQPPAPVDVRAVTPKPKAKLKTRPKPKKDELDLKKDASK